MGRRRSGEEEEEEMEGGGGRRGFMTAIWAATDCIYYDNGRLCGLMGGQGEPSIGRN